MIVICDINEVWRRKPFAALAEITDTLGVAPADWKVARTHPDFKSNPGDGAMTVLPAMLPPGWASRTAWVGQRLLWRRIHRHARSIDREINALVVTSPHYLPLLDLIPPDLKTIYYASDDYHSYEGWDHVLDQERTLMDRVDHAFFVSEGLMERACDAYGIPAHKASVSMNATEARFCQTDDRYPAAPPCGELQRPIAGVVGGINDRLDFELLLKCADMERLGTLPVSYTHLRAHETS